MFGWQIVVAKEIFGGECGYVWGISMKRRKRAFSKGVSLGPRMKAHHWKSEFFKEGNRMISSS
jgi:hypothetical protein